MLNIKVRVLKYLLLLIFSFITPYILLLIMMILNQSREFSLPWGIGLTFLSTNIVFSIFFLKSTYVRNILYGILTTVISIVAVILIMHFKIKPEFDFYGGYTALFIYAVSSIICWELIYQLNEKTTANK